MSTHTKNYGLLTTPILHTILIPRKNEKTKTKKQPEPSQRSPNVCNQRHLKISVEITSTNQKKRK